jgi:anti-anti-sigma factor
MPTYARADHERSAIVVSIGGEIDLARETELLARLQPLEPPPGATVAVDLSNVTFVDSAGVRGIERTRAYLKNRGCELQLFNPSHRVAKVIILLGLDDSLSFGDGPDGEAAVTPAENDGESCLPG